MLKFNLGNVNITTKVIVRIFLLILEFLEDILDTNYNNYETSDPN